MFKVGDLVKITYSSYYIEDRDNGDEGRLGLVVDKDEGPDVVYTILIVDEDGKPNEYYYYEHELETLE